MRIEGDLKGREFGPFFAADPADKYRAIFHAIEEGFCIIELIFDFSGKPVDYRFLEVNSRFEEQCGIVDAVGKTMREIAPDHEEVWFEVYGKVALTGESVRIESFAKELLRWFEVFAFRLDPAEASHVAILFKDISSRKRAEETLRLAAVADNYRITLADAIRPLTTAAEIEAMACRTIGRFLGANRVHYSIIDGDTVVISQAYLDGLQVASGRHPLDDYPTLRDWSRLGKAFYSNDYRQDGRFTEDERRRLASFPVRAMAVVPLVKGGELIAQFSVHFCEPHEWTPDQIALTEETVERTWAALERARAEEALREADRRKDEFLATLAHELRNPLAPLRTGLQLMQIAGEDREQIAKVREMMERQVSQMVRLIDDLMDVSRISRGKLELKVADMLLDEAVDHAIETSRPVFEARGHRLEVYRPAEPIKVLGDSTRLSQAIANLLNNAAKYSEPGETVILTVTAEDGFADIEVADNGVGIDAADFGDVFKMFCQVSRNEKLAQDGLGIGLHLVKTIVELHQGRVSVASPGLGKGSRFTIRLPRIHTETRAGEQVSSPDPDMANARVLVVDDNVDAATVLQKLLQFSGHEVQTAHDGPDALDICEAFRPQVVLLDIGLPTMNGLDVARELRQKPWGREMFLVALTGWSQEQDRELSREAGFDKHVVKPITHDALEKIIQDAFRARG